MIGAITSPSYRPRFLGRQGFPKNVPSYWEFPVDRFNRDTGRPHSFSVLSKAIAHARSIAHSYRNYVCWLARVFADSHNYGLFLSKLSYSEVLQ